MASSKLGHTATIPFHAALLTVIAEPTHEVEQGETAVLSCTVQSSPSPRIGWYRVESNGNETRLAMQQSTDADFGMYRIINVQVSDAGIYRCKGSYSFDNKDVDIELIVLSKFYKLSYMHVSLCM